MAGTGRPPAENKRRRNADLYEGLEVTVTAASSNAPKLPGASGYSRQTQAWYATWATAPQSQAFVVTDWQRLHMLAPLVDRYFLAPDKGLMAEIRLNEALLGATHVDRLRARIKVAGESAPTEPTEGSDEVAARRRKRMTDAS